MSPLNRVETTALEAKARHAQRLALENPHVVAADDEGTRPPTAVRVGCLHQALEVGFSGHQHGGTVVEDPADCGVAAACVQAPAEFGDYLDCQGTSHPHQDNAIGQVAERRAGRKAGNWVQRRRWLHLLGTADIVCCRLPPSLRLSDPLGEWSIHRAVDMPELLSGDSQGSVVQSMNVNRKLV